MPLTPGSRLGPYEIAAQIGAGGMGEVYRATDTNLKRQVAIKVLPLSLAGDADRLARFQREAEVLASLNHPNIAAIHGLDRSDGYPALVMELVEGPTLADRIAQGAVPLDEAMAIAKQVADALESAHERGIIHRDLKPANIKVRPDGTVKVLDFGLAKLARVSTDSRDVSDASTAMATHAGLILGTMAYMSPEQARGQDIDKRTDVWAFGCVLYEMLSGQRLFEGEDTSEILANVLKSDPDWRRLPSGVPESVRLLLRRCLQKDSRRRFHDMADVHILLDEAGSASGLQTAVEPRRTTRVSPWILAAALMLAAATGVWFVRTPPTLSEDLLDVVTLPTSSPASFALAPNDSSIVFVATSGIRSGLWLRSKDAIDAQPLPQTDGAVYPFWAPNSLAIGFFADGKLKVIEIGSRTVRELTDAAPLGGSWSQNGTILFTRGYSSPLLRIADSGNEPVPVTRLDEHRHTSHRFPHFLPDGRRFLYTATGAGTFGVHVGNLDAAGSRRVLPAGGAVYAPRAGRLLFVEDGTLRTQRFDLDNAVLLGDASLLAGNVELDSSLAVPLSASASGRIAYRTTLAQRQLTWFDRSGTMLRRLGDAFNGGSIELSPDEQRIALHRTLNGITGIWLVDTERGLFSPLAPDHLAYAPVWAGNDRDVVFSRATNGIFSPYRQQIGSRDGPQPLFATSQFIIVQDWSPDKRFVLYVEVDQSRVDLWARPTDGSGARIPVANTKGDERLGQFSPDAKWVAYMSDASGRFEVLVQPFPANGSPPTQVSAAGGGQPRWRRDSKGLGLYYIALDGSLIDVSLQPGADGRPVTVGAASRLFTTSVGGALQGPPEKHQYVVTRDGRFLMNTVVDSAAGSRIIVLQNWKAED